MDYFINIFCYFVKGTVFDGKQLKQKNGLKIFAKNKGCFDLQQRGGNTIRKRSYWYRTSVPVNTA